MKVTLKEVRNGISPKDRIILRLSNMNEIFAIYNCIQEVPYRFDFHEVLSMRRNGGDVEILLYNTTSPPNIFLLKKINEWLLHENLTEEETLKIKKLRKIALCERDG